MLLLSGYPPKPRMKYRCCYRVGDFQHCPTCLSMRSIRLFRFFFSVRCEILLLRIVRYLVRQFYEHFFSNFQTKIFFPLQNVFQIEFLRWPLRKIISFFHSDISVYAINCQSSNLLSVPLLSIKWFSFRLSIHSVVSAKTQFVRKTCE